MMPRIASTLLILLSVFNISQSLPDGLRAVLHHVDAGSNYTKHELLQRMIHRSKNRARFLATSYSDTSGTDVTLPSFPSSKDNIQYNNEYLVNISIGTPAEPFVLTLDTGSDLIWTQCDPLVRYFDQPYPFFNPNNSYTFNYTSCESQMCYLPPGCSNSNYCQYNYSYGDGSYTSGRLAIDTFTLGSTSVPGIYFGCGNDNAGIFVSNECGIAGFGRGNLSLVSQLGYGNFSYCFTTIGESKSSPVFFGSTTELNGVVNGSILSTPLILNSVYPSFYYLTLTGITVGTKLLDIPVATFAMNSTDGSGGVIIDSGTGVTTFPESVYEAVTTEFVSQVELDPVVDSGYFCFNLSSSNTSEEFQPPKFIFHFEGADLELPTENYMFQISEGIECLAISNTSDTLSIIGNFQQQNIHILYDLVGEQLLFVPTQCDQL